MGYVDILRDNFEEKFRGYFLLFHMQAYVGNLNERYELFLVILHNGSGR